MKNKISTSFVFISLSCFISGKAQSGNIDKQEDYNQTDRYFNYSFVNDGVALYSIIEEGTKQETIILPEKIDVFDVIDYSCDLFVACKSVRQISFPKSISVIYLDDINSIPSLERIILLQNDPTKIRFNRFATTINFDIYVPLGSLTAYITNFNWSIYSNRIFEMNDSQ